MEIERIKQHAHDPMMCVSDEVRQMARELLALQWQPITPENLPKVGDEVLRLKDVHTVYDTMVSAYRNAEEWHKANWSHRRPINPPKEANRAE